MLNYYGYALFFWHTLSAWSGQLTDLPGRTIGFSPHPSAFDAASQTAVLPILLGGGLGTATITPTAAVLRMEFWGDLGPKLSFSNVTICQHSFAAPGTAHVLAPNAPLVLALPAPCASAASGLAHIK